MLVSLPASPRPTKCAALRADADADTLLRRKIQHATGRDRRRERASKWRDASRIRAHPAGRFRKEHFISCDDGGENQSLH